MRILIAEDDPISRRVLDATLQRWGYEVTLACDGNEAWDKIREPESPSLIILDWMMPGVDGVTLCKRIREIDEQVPRYILLLTAKGERADMIAGLEAGADDYVTKPFAREELRARLQVGERVISLQQALVQRVAELERAMEQVNTLRGILPICCYCKRVRDDENFWQRVEAYISQHSEARFSHGICPECWETVVQPELAESDAAQALAQSLGVEQTPVGEESPRRF